LDDHIFGLTVLRERIGIGGRICIVLAIECLEETFIAEAERSIAWRDESIVLSIVFTEACISGEGVFFCSL